MLAIIFFITLLALSYQLDPIKQTQLWFDGQLLNHDEPLSNTTWSQRYWVIDQFYEPETGPVILYICGEYTCPGLPEDRHWPAVIAEKYGGLILVLEHRYYGNSMPFGDDSLHFDNLYLLTIDQALADLAYFINWVKTSNQHQVPATAPWFTIGGSYPGAMSAWFRYKYPHLTVGAIASSAVIEAILDFQMFDTQIKLSADKSGDWCSQAIHDLNFYAQDQVINPKTSHIFKSQFNATEVENGQFLFYYADIFVELIQYGSRTELCNALQGKTLEEQSQYVIDYANENGITVYEYSSYYLSYDGYDPEDPQGSRQWTYQYCTQVGFFQTAPEPYSESMRSPLVDMDMYTQLCEQSFGDNTIFPTVDRVNLDFGGLGIETFNIVFTNGSEDPWKWASLLETNSTYMKAIEIDCDDCAHCVDLYTPTESDPQPLKDARDVEISEISRWIKEYNDKYGYNFTDKPKNSKQEQEIIY